MDNNIHILFDGTSSAGKTTLCKLLNKYEYTCIDTDDCYRIASMKYYENIENKFYTRDERKHITEQYFLNILFEKGFYNKKTVYDFAPQDKLSDMYLKHGKKIFIVFIYAPLNKIIDNIHSRRIIEPRGLSVFDQFCTKYKYTTDLEKSIDVVNKSVFIDKLLSKLQYLFTSRDELNKFADRIFESIGIYDDNIYNIKVRDELKYDYLLNTHNKQPDELVKELHNAIINFS